MNELTTQQPNAIWANKEEIKKLYAPKATDAELALFLQLGTSLDANPATRDIYFIKYGSGDAQIFLGLNFYVKTAVGHPQYDGHQSQAIFEKDEFYIEKGEPVFKRAKGDRGKLVGAYCVVYKKDNRIPMVVEVALSEYSTGKSLWGANGKPQTMICKVAESQALRKAFPEKFNGTYSEAEQWEDTNYTEVKETPKKKTNKAVELVYDQKKLDMVFKNSATPDLFSDDEIEKLDNWVNAQMKKGRPQSDIEQILKDKYFERFNEQ